VTELGATPFVYVLNLEDQDVEHAKTFGRLRVIYRGRINPFKTDGIIRHLHDVLAESNPGDWILPTGANVLGIVASIEMIRRHKRLNLLLWHARERKYIPRVFHADFESDFSEAFLQSILPEEAP
jgi:hypothetical protein